MGTHNIVYQGGQEFLAKFIMFCRGALNLKLRHWVDDVLTNEGGSGLRVVLDLRYIRVVDSYWKS